MNFFIDSYFKKNKILNYKKKKIKYKLYEKSKKSYFLI